MNCLTSIRTPQYSTLILSDALFIRLNNCCRKCTDTDEIMND
jgi:hypothetical protein